MGTSTEDGERERGDGGIARQRDWDGLTRGVREKWVVDRGELNLLPVDVDARDGEVRWLEGEMRRREENEGRE